MRASRPGRTSMDTSAVGEMAKVWSRASMMRATMAGGTREGVPPPKKTLVSGARERTCAVVAHPARSLERMQVSNRAANRCSSLLFIIGTVFENNFFLQDQTPFHRAKTILVEQSETRARTPSPSSEMAHLVVELHHWDAQVSSDNSEGSTMHLALKSTL